MSEHSNKRSDERTGDYESDKKTRLPKKARRVRGEREREERKRAKEREVNAEIIAPNCPGQAQRYLHALGHCLPANLHCPLTRGNEETLAGRETNDRISCREKEAIRVKVCACLCVSGCARVCVCVCSLNRGSVRALRTESIVSRLKSCHNTPSTVD